jgi:RIO-like serine/threonine protein kinase
MRDCLTAIEGNVLMDSKNDFVDMHLNEFASLPELSKYNGDDIAYSMHQLSDAGFIVFGRLHVAIRQSGYYVRSLTYKGHEFLADIHDEKIWDHVKGISKKVGATSVTAITQIATGVISEIIKSYLRASGTIS